MRWAAAVMGGLVLCLAGSAGADCPGVCTGTLCDEAERDENWILVEGERRPELESPDESHRFWYEITAIHGGPGGSLLRTGEVIETWRVASDRALLILDPRGEVDVALEIYGNDRVRCANGEMGSARRAAAIAAVLSDDCERKARRAGLTGECSDTPVACSTASGSTPAAWGALASLALLAFRRRGAA